MGNEAEACREAEVVKTFDLPYGMRGTVKLISVDEATRVADALFNVFAVLGGGESMDVNNEAAWHCGYLAVPKHLADRLGWTSSDYDDYEDLPLHGGCTCVDRTWDEDGMEVLVIGWDYRHYGDAMAEFDADRVEADVREFARYVVVLLERADAL